MRYYRSHLVSILGVSTLTVGFIEGIARSHGLDHQDILRRAVRLARQAQAARRSGLRPRRLHQAGFSARVQCRLADRGPLHRPGWQGHPRRSPRRAGRGHRAGASAWREFRSTPVTRHRGCLRRSTQRDRLMLLTAEQFHHRVLDRGHSWVHRLRSAAGRGRRAHEAYRS